MIEVRHAFGIFVQSNAMGVTECNESLLGIPFIQFRKGLKAK